MQLLPDARIRPLINVLVGLALEVEPADLRRAHAQQREPAFVIRIDQLFRRWWRLGQNTEPAERIHAIVKGQCARGNRRTAHTVKAVAARDEVAFDLLRFTARVITNFWPGRPARVA